LLKSDLFERLKDTLENLGQTVTFCNSFRNV
jgi:hypothetical protein